MLGLFFIITKVVCATWLELLEKSDPIALAVQRPKCVQEAIQDILPLCISAGVEFLDPELRKLLAVKLSICEFDNAGILYPGTCQDLEHNLDKCLVDIERSPQYWTTFSGYYREIQTICYEEALPYEKDHILGLFANVTYAYSHFFDLVKRSLEFAANSHQNLQNQFGSLEKSMVLMFADYKELTADASQDLNQYRAELDKVMNQALQTFDRTSGVYLGNMDEMELELERITHRLHELTHFVDKNLSDVVDEFQQVHNWSSVAQTNLDKILDNMQNVEIITVANEHRATKMGLILEQHQELALDIGESLEESGSLIQEQRQSLRREMEILLYEMQIVFEEHFAELFNVSAKKVEDFALIINSQLNSKVNETENRLAELNYNIDEVVSRVSNVTEALDHGLQQWKQMLNVVHRARQNLAAWRINLVAPLRGLSDLATRTTRYLLLMVAISILLSCSWLFPLFKVGYKVLQLMVVLFFFACGSALAHLVLHTLSSLSRIAN